MSYANTVKDVSRAVAYLDENAANENAGEAVERVSKEFAYQFHRTFGLGSRRRVTARDVRYALAAHGASYFTVDRYARVIASRIRGDFSDGRG